MPATSSGGGLDKILFTELRLLSKQVSQKEPFFAEIACLGGEYPELLAYIDIYRAMFPEDLEFNQWLVDLVKPALKKLGQVTWSQDADTLTVMGLKLGETKQSRSLARYAIGKNKLKASKNLEIEEPIDDE